MVAGRPPRQAAAGAVDLWPVLRDPGAPAAVARGELDEILLELHAMARAHADHSLLIPIRERAAAVGLSLEASAPFAHPDQKPFGGFGKRTG